MSPSLRVVLPLLVAAGCQTYGPEPLDLEAHSRAFAGRMPDPELLRAFASEVCAAPTRSAVFDLADGLDLGEARYVALFCQAALRIARAERGIAEAAAEYAGRWEDPQLSGSFFYVLERSWQYQWFGGVYLAQTLPITGMPGLEKAVAGTQRELAVLQARAAESAAIDRLDAAWVRHSTARRLSELLDDYLSRLLELESLANGLAASGASMRLEARAFALARIRAEAEVATARAEVERSRLAVMAALGLPPDAKIELVPRIALTARVSNESLRDEVLAGPSVRIAARRHEVAERVLEREVRKQWPDLWVQPGWQEEDAQPRPAFGFSLPLPLWNANARGIAEARAARTVAGESARAGVEAALHALADAEVARTAAAARRAHFAEQLVPLAMTQLADVRRLAELGQIDALLALDAVTRSYDAQRAVVEAAADEAAAVAALNTLFWPVLDPVVPE